MKIWILILLLSCVSKNKDDSATKKTKPIIVEQEFSKTKEQHIYGYKTGRTQTISLLESFKGKLSEESYKKQIIPIISFATSISDELIKQIKNMSEEEIKLLNEMNQISRITDNPESRKIMDDVLKTGTVKYNEAQVKEGLSFDKKSMNTYEKMYPVMASSGMEESKVKKMMEQTVTHAYFSLNNNQRERLLQILKNKEITNHLDTAMKLSKLPQKMMKVQMAVMNSDENK